MHTSPFISSEPVLFGVLESSEEYDLGDSLHSNEDERSSSSLTMKTEKKSTRRQIRCAARIKHSTRVRVADKIVGKSVGCAQKSGRQECGLRTKQLIMV